MRIGYGKIIQNINYSLYCVDIALALKRADRGSYSELTIDRHDFNELLLRPVGLLAASRPAVLQSMLRLGSIGDGIVCARAVGAIKHRKRIDFFMASALQLLFYRTR